MKNLRKITLLCFTCLLLLSSICMASDAVASVGSSSFFVGLGYAINSMVVIGTTIKLAQAIGRKETEKEKEYINAGLVINLIIALRVLKSTAILPVEKKIVENNAAAFGSTGDSADKELYDLISNIFNKREYI